MAVSRVALINRESVAVLRPAFRQGARLVSLCRLEQRCLTSNPTPRLPTSPSPSMPLQELERLCLPVHPLLQRALLAVERQLL